MVSVPWCRGCDRPDTCCRCVYPETDAQKIARLEAERDNNAAMFKAKNTAWLHEKMANEPLRTSVRLLEGRIEDFKAQAMRDFELHEHLEAALESAKAELAEEQRNRLFAVDLAEALKAERDEARGVVKAAYSDILAHPILAMDTLFNALKRWGMR